MTIRVRGPDGTIVNFPDDTSDDVMASAMRAHFGGPEGVAEPQATETAADVAKSGGIGVVKGGLGLAGLPGDVGSLISAGADKLGIPQGVKSAVSTAVRGLPGVGAMALGPTSQQLRGGLEGVTGPLYEPKTTAGEYAQTAGEFLPAALAGPGGIARKAVTQALIPAAVSETAGQATKGTAAEPYARVLGGLAGGAAAGRVAQRGLPEARVTPAQVEQRSAAGYQSPEVGTLIFQPQAVDDLATNISGALRRSKSNDRLAPATNALVDDLRTPVNGIWHTYEDLQTTREQLQKQAGNFANPQESRAATVALRQLDNYIDNIPQRDLLAGQGARASATLQRSRADYAAAKSAERVEEKIRNADLQAASTYSGGNVNNATRQKLRTLLTSRKQRRGLNDDELALIEANVRGSPTGNVARALGKFLGGGGGMQAFNAASVGGGTGAFLGGPIGAMIGVAAPIAAGQASRRVGDALTRRRANQIVQAILARAPSGPGQARANRIARALAQRGLTPLQAGAAGGGLAGLPLSE